jgi:hypothetical protein
MADSILGFMVSTDSQSISTRKLQPHSSTKATLTRRHQYLNTFSRCPIHLPLRSVIVLLTFCVLNEFVDVKVEFEVRSTI